jgi:hypothetical protein
MAAGCQPWLVKHVTSTITLQQGHQLSRPPCSCRGPHPRANLHAGPPNSLPVGTRLEVFCSTHPPTNQRHTTTVMVSISQVKQHRVAARLGNPTVVKGLWGWASQPAAMWSAYCQPTSVCGTDSAPRASPAVHALHTQPEGGGAAAPHTTHTQGLPVGSTAGTPGLSPGYTASPSSLLRLPACAAVCLLSALVASPCTCLRQARGGFCLDVGGRGGWVTSV